MVYRKVSLDITPAQLKRAASGQQITLSAAQLKGSGSTFHVHPANHEKIMKATRAGKGTRVYIAPGAINHDLEHMQGASIWSWIRDKAIPWVKKNWNVIKPVVSAAGDALAVAFPEAAPIRAQVKALTGVGVRGGKLVKGSQAAKDHMAKLRSKRSGGSFML